MSAAKPQASCCACRLIRLSFLRSSPCSFAARSKLSCRWRGLRSRCTSKIILPKAFRLRILPDRAGREAGQLAEVGGPQARQECRRLGLDLRVDPCVLVWATLVVAISNALVVGDGKSQDREDQLPGAGRHVAANLLRGS